MFVRTLRSRRIRSYVALSILGAACACGGGNTGPGPDAAACSEANIAAQDYAQFLKDVPSSVATERGDLSKVLDDLIAVDSVAVAGSAVKTAADAAGTEAGFDFSLLVGGVALGTSGVIVLTTDMQNLATACSKPGA